jgi:hypothetical protein
LSLRLILSLFWFGKVRVVFIKKGAGKNRYKKKYINISIMKAYKLQVKKMGKTVQAMITIPRAIWEGKGWGHGSEIYFKFGPKGEVILEDTNG